MSAAGTYLGAVILAAFAGSWLGQPGSLVAEPVPRPPVEVACAPCPAPAVCGPCPTPACPEVVAAPSLWPAWVWPCAVCVIYLAGCSCGACGAATLGAAAAAVRHFCPARPPLGLLPRGRDPGLLAW